MFEYFAFVDESIEKQYRLCLVAVPTSELNVTRKSLSTLRLKGQKRIHMSKESDARKVQILNHIQKMENWKCIILETKVSRLSNSEARQRLFFLASSHKLWKSITHLVIEDSTDRDRDQSTLTWIKNNSEHKIDFDFAKPSEDECLWLADALAWAYAKGGNWRKKIKSRVDLVAGP